jgi:hypothetical protein
VDLTDSLRVEIRTLLQDLRSAAAHWDRVEPHFPSESEWREHVRTAVAADSWPAGRASFWYGGSEVDWTRLRMTVLAIDIVGVSVPFATNRTAGTFGAVLMFQDGVWTRGQRQRAVQANKRMDQPSAYARKEAE